MIKQEILKRLWEKIGADLIYLEGFYLSSTSKLNLQNLTLW